MAFWFANWPRLLPLLLLLGGLPAVGPAATLPEKLVPAVPCRALREAAKKQGIPVDGIERVSPSGGLQPGDSVTGLVTFFQKNTPKAQWLISIRVGAPETSDKPEGNPGSFVLYASSGLQLQYTSAPVTLDLAVLGPCAPRESPRRGVGLKRAHFSANEGFLELGLDRAAAALLRLRESKAPGILTFKPEPGSAAEVAEGKKVVEGAHLSPAELRALGGALPALVSYFKIVQQTPGLQDVLSRVVDKPSVWSVIRHVGIKTHLTFETGLVCQADPAAWGAPGEQPLYLFPVVMDLNGHRALNLRFLVTAPKRPLLVCGGTVAVLAQNPALTDEYLLVQAVSGRCGPAPATRPGAPVRDTPGDDSK